MHDKQVMPQEAFCGKLPQLCVQLYKRTHIIKLMHTARIFNNGNSQAVRLPKQFRLDASEVFIRKDAATGDIVLSAHPASGSWAEFFALRAKARMPADFLAGRPLNQVAPGRDPFAVVKRAKASPKQ